MHTTCIHMYMYMYVVHHYVHMYSQSHKKRGYSWYSVVSKWVTETILNVLISIPHMAGTIRKKGNGHTSVPQMCFTTMQYSLTGDMCMRPLKWLYSNLVLWKHYQLKEVAITSVTITLSTLQALGPSHAKVYIFTPIS